MPSLDRSEQRGLLAEAELSLPQQILHLVMYGVRLARGIHGRGEVKEEEVRVHVQHKLSELRPLSARCGSRSRTPSRSSSSAPSRVVVVDAWPSAPPPPPPTPSSAFAPLPLLPPRRPAVRSPSSSSLVASRPVVVGGRARRKLRRRLGPRRACKDEAALELFERAAHLSVHLPHRATAPRTQQPEECVEEAPPDAEEHDGGHRRKDLHVETVGVDEVINRAHRLEQLRLDDLHLNEEEAEQLAADEPLERTSLDLRLVCP